jgi:hypothetical protein
MLRSLHLVEIDIFNIPYRPCRPYQERIADYYNSGRPRFEWEKIRQKMLMEGDQAIVRVCSPCGLNILGDAEGCKIRIEGLTTFLSIVSNLSPQNRLSGFSFSDDLLSRDDTRILHDELERLSGELTDMKWPVAQLFLDDEPQPDPTGMRGALFYEFEGGDLMTVVFSNKGFTVGIGRDGLEVTESSGTNLPERFTRLWKDGANVYGETVGGRLMPFLPVENELPAWDDSPNFARSELRLIELPLLEIFADVIESLLVFASTALANNTGLKISAVG